MKKLFLAMFMVMSTAIFAQKITGVVVDKTKLPVVGATISIKGGTTVTMTNIDGEFEIETREKTATIVVKSIGFETQSVQAKAGQKISITLVTNVEQLESLVLVGGGVIDLVKERETPVASSTIKAETIIAKVGNQEFPEILNSTPSVYATKQGGGYGDSRINIRGFDQRNISIIINGQPVNDMENGWVFWSNWAGLSDIASVVQIQRGLGASNLAVPSVGGTINVVTKSTDKKEGGFGAVTYGNDNYIKTVAGYNTGISENGFAASVLLGKWQGDGYVKGTQGEGYTYLIGLGYKGKGDHSFNFTYTGAGQWHNQRDFELSIRDYLNFGGEGDFQKFNADWGYKDGKEYSFRRNFYNKPIATLNWDWEINENLTASTSIYGSWGRGGGTGTRGRNFGINPFRNDLTGAIDGLPYRTANGLIDFDAIVANNQAGSVYTRGGAHDGAVLGSNGYSEDGVNTNIAIRRASMNSHDWYGAISNFKYEMDDFTFGLGVDLRTYKGYHYRVLNDLLGLDGYVSTGDDNLIGGVVVTETIDASPFKDTGLTGQKINYYNIGDVKWGGFNGIAEYKTEQVSAVIQGGLSKQLFKRIDYFNQVGNVESKVSKINGGYVKGGANYNINDEHNVFFNAGYISRQPNFDAVFQNFANNITEDLQNEKITSIELGYGFKNEMFTADLNLYATRWEDRFISESLTVGTESFSTNFEGVTQLHTGIELEASARPLDILTFKGMISIGDWKYDGNANAAVFDDNQVKVVESTLYLDNVRVGDAAQLTANLNGEVEVIKNLKINANWRYASRLYADFDADDSEFYQEDNKGAIKLPSFDLFDLGLSYKLDLPKKTALKVFANVNNVFNTKYIAEGNSNIHTTETSTTYKGIDKTNQVWFGFGTTWNTSIRYEF